MSGSGAGMEEENGRRERERGWSGVGNERDGSGAVVGRGMSWMEADWEREREHYAQKTRH